MKSLDKIDMRILYELDKNCRITDNKLAKIVKRSRESVRHRIKKLVKEEIIQGFIISIDPAAFGRTGFKMYFQLKNNTEQRKKFQEKFKKLHGIYWYAESDGIWDFHATFYVEDITTFNNIKNEVFTEFKDLIVKRDTGVLVNVRQYVRKFLYSEIKERPEPTIYGQVNKLVDGLDELEKKILAIMSKNATISIVSLAQKTNSTVDIIRNKLKKMEERKIFFQNRIALNHNKLGFSMYKAFVYFDHISKETETKLFEYAKQETRIFNLVRQLSAWDVELEIMARNYEEFTDIMNDIREKFKDTIRNYELALIKEENWILDRSNTFF